MWEIGLRQDLWRKNLSFLFSANSEQIYDSFSLPSACVCFYKSPSSFRINLKTARPPASSSRLPRCEAGAKLDLPRFVNSFSSPTSRRQKASSIRRRTRTDFDSDLDFTYPEPEESVRRPRNWLLLKPFLSSSRSRSFIWLYTRITVWLLCISDVLFMTFSWFWDWL